MGSRMLHSRACAVEQGDDVPTSSTHEQMAIVAECDDSRTPNGLVHVVDGPACDREGFFTSAKGQQVVLDQVRVRAISDARLTAGVGDGGTLDEDLRSRVCCFKRYW